MNVKEAMILSQHYQWACGSTATTWQLFKKIANGVFPKKLRKVKHLEEIVTC